MVRIGIVSVGFMGMIDWGIMPPPQRPTMHKVDDEPRLSNFLMAIVNILAGAHVVCGLLALHYLRRPSVLVFAISAVQLLLTLYFWHRTGSAFAVGGWTWNPMNG